MVSSYLFLQQDDSEVYGGPARLMVAASSYPLAVRIQELFDTTTYAPNTTYGMEDIGATEVGVTFTREVSEKEWKTDQFGLFKTFPDEYKSTISTRAMQPTPRNRQILMQGSIGNANEDGASVTYFEAAPALDVWHYYVIMKDDQNRWHVRAYPSCQWDGKQIKELFQRATPDTIEFTVTAYPSTDVVGPNGAASERYDIDTTA